MARAPSGKIWPCCSAKQIDLSEREARAWERIREHTELLRGKRVFFTADNLMELPLARFLRHAGCEIVECSSTYINRKFHARELAALDGVEVYLSSPTSTGSWARSPARSPIWWSAPWPRPTR